MTNAASDQAQAIEAGRPWWESRVVLALVIFAAAVPLLYPAIPPLVDLPGHMGRYRVELDLANSPWLQQYFNYHWAAIGNLGVDLAVMGLGPIIGLEPAVKVIVLAIPTLTAAGFLWVAREVHGRIPPTTYFAIPFIYGHPFLFGFVNFALSMALAFLAFGLWLRLGRLGRTRLRSVLFAPISVAVFFAHTYGWGVLGLLCFSAEAVRQHDRGIGWRSAGINAAVQASVMALPILITIIWRSEAHGGSTGDWFDLEAKLLWVKTALRDRWSAFDLASVAVAGVVLAEALRNRHLTFSRNLAFSGLVLVAAFLLIPRIVFGSAYADMRLVPYAIAVLLLAIRFRGETTRRLGMALAVLALAYAGIRLGSNTISLAMAANDQQDKLQALGYMPEGSRVAGIYELPCGVQWALPRNSHLGSMVIVRRHGFSNDQWVMEGLNLLDLKYWKAGRFTADPSNIVRPDVCPDRIHRTIDAALAELPRDAFDFVWMLDVASYDPKLTTGMQPVWRNGRSILYRLH
jgi:hypothetical protein